MKRAQPDLGRCARKGEGIATLRVQEQRGSNGAPPILGSGRARTRRTSVAHDLREAVREQHARFVEPDVAATLRQCPKLPFRTYEIE